MNTMQNSRFFGWIVFILIFAYCGYASANGLCDTNEIVVFSFETGAHKNLSICKHSNRDYLVYRYGSSDSVEFQYPKTLSKKSWDAFSFSGMKRGGGKANSGFGDYDLSFSNKGFSYVVFQMWNDEDDTYSIGVVVRNEKTKRETHIDGVPSSQKGSLVLLEDEGRNIKNTAW